MESNLQIDGTDCTKELTMEEYFVKVDEYGTIRRYRGDKLDCLDGPAIEYTDGYKEWYRDDKLDRRDGPAIECVDGSKAWYIDGEEYSQDEFNKITKNKS
jgi:hypothetical protein